MDPNTRYRMGVPQVAAVSTIAWLATELPTSAFFGVSSDTRPVVSAIIRPMAPAAPAAPCATPNSSITRSTVDAAGLQTPSPVQVVVSPAVVDLTAWLDTEKMRSASAQSAYFAPAAVTTRLPS